MGIEHVVFQDFDMLTFFFVCTVLGKQALMPGASKWKRNWPGLHMNEFLGRMDHLCVSFAAYCSVVARLLDPPVNFIAFCVHDVCQLPLFHVLSDKRTLDAYIWP